jgi:hypothetical protein
MEQIRLVVCVIIITVAALPIPANAWNIPAHMLSAAIAYQILQQENSQTIDKVKSVLENIPGTQTNGRRGFRTFPVGDRGLVLFMQAV